MIKRFFDVALSIAGLIAAGPLMLVTALMIRIDSAGPVLFKQERIGRGGRPFRVYKFRTMVEGADQIGPAITAHNDPRLTQIGVLLRWLKIDELPQLINVLKGDMSLVGPRPEVPKIVRAYSEEQRGVFAVRPGIIGPSQIANRDEAAMLKDHEDTEKYYAEKILPEKIRRDLDYVRSTDPLKDVKVLIGGLAKTFLGSIKLSYILESRRRIFFLLFDILISLCTYGAAFLLRFEGDIPEPEMTYIKLTLPVVALVRAPCFIYFGLYQSLWQYLGIQELLAIIKAVAVGSLLLPFIPFLLQAGFQPRSTLIIDSVLLMAALSGSRVLFKITADRVRQPRLGAAKNVLIVGADDTGELLVREFIRRPELGFRAVGFIDNDPLKQNMRIHGVKVLGKIHQLPQVVRVKHVDEVIIAFSAPSRQEVKNIAKRCRALNLVCRIVPQASSLMPPHALPLRLRPVDVSDLLGRELVQADLAGIQRFLHDKKVLVTGAGGSIGAELAKIIFQSNPRELVLVDHQENNLYEIETTLQSRPGEAAVSTYLRDVTRAEEMREIFRRHRPDLIYHAAAHKHVPLIEVNYKEGVLNNILGTKVVADLAAEFGAERFVLISTDKAIRPVSIMGVTKRIAELYIQSLPVPKTRFLAVRFGNVFNSKGSVVPLFRRQIEEGGPITLTDENVKRYFMDVSEAVFLILQATLLGSDSEIFVLDMGRPVRIADLARELVQLMGLQAEQIPVRVIGLRPGEKLEEDLELDGEKAIPTSHKKIRIWKSDALPHPHLAREIAELLRLAANQASRDEIVERLQKIVPEYQPYRFPS